jgi:ketosteroid isomerase-like protein
MKSFISLSLRIILALLAVALSAEGVFAATEKEIDQIEDARYEAMMRGDLVSLANILADEFVYHQPTGNVATKASYIEQIRSGEVKIRKAERYGVKIHFYGNVATVMGSTRLDLELKGERSEVDLYYLNVWVLRDGRWQIVVRQSAFKKK